jgi:hypothetical protein
MELQHDFLWRTTRDLPERGRIGIFNRSYYEEVLIVRGCLQAHLRELVDREIGVPDEQRIRFRIGVNLGDVIVDTNNMSGR